MIMQANIAPPDLVFPQVNVAASVAPRQDFPPCTERLFVRDELGPCPPHGGAFATLRR